jgi:hypothetical protein
MSVKPLYSEACLFKSRESGNINMSQASITPCVGICSSGIGDDVCRGCKRFAHEVIDWNNYSDADRQVVMARLDNFLIKIIKIKIQLIDYSMYLKSIDSLGLEFEQTPEPYLQWYKLLKAEGERLKSKNWGFAVRANYLHLSMTGLRDNIEAEYFDLSRAHYDRYIAPGIVGNL